MKRNFIKLEKSGFGFIYVLAMLIFSFTSNSVYASKAEVMDKTILDAVED